MSTAPLLFINKIKVKRILVTCSIAIIATSIQAQTRDAKWNVGIVAGVAQYKGSMGNNFYKFNTPTNLVAGAAVTRYIAERIDLNLLVGRGGVGVEKNNARIVNYFSMAMLGMRVHILSRSAPIRPYALIGIGTMFYDKNSNVKSDIINFIAPSYGGGINFNLGSSVRLNLQEAFHYTSKDKIDINVPNEKATFLFHTVGVSFDIANKVRK